jgi:N-acetylglucosaminyldiphosphoundecaprenol N-acetyl-beta-D-mannosaminyltransferase
MSEWRFPEGEFLGQRITLLGEPALLAAVEDAIQRRRPLYQASLNAAKVVAGRRDPGARRLLDGFDVISADGMSVAWGTRLMGLRGVERVAGIDLMQALLGRAESRDWNVYFMGATPEVLATMQTRLRQRYPRLRIAGALHGYHPAGDDPTIAATIAASHADLLFVGMPSPRKEIFLQEQRDHLGVSFAMGVGGSFDVLAGKVSRAPGLMQRAGLEWAYRLAQEPSRLWRRYLVSNSRFLLLLMQARLWGRPADKASG